MATQEAPSEAPTPPEAPQVAGIKRKNLIIIAVVGIAAWGFAIHTGSTALLIVVGVLTLLVTGVLLWAFRMLKKQRGLVSMLQGATESPEARREALAKLNAQKDAGTPVNVFARAQLLAADDPKAALELLTAIELSKYPAAMQDDVALLETQLYLGTGRTADARKTADHMNLDNPERKKMRPLAASLVAEAWARTGKPKEALALLDSIEVPSENREQIQVQMRVARVFAKFAANQRGQARSELLALADVDPNHLGRFVMPQFRVHPELQKLARSVAQQHPGVRKQVIKGSAKPARR
ncbi:MAG TPA: hypothetical protein VMJ10_35790 [Kofleriaceae bacterium]|nr:hypothetical protein [Kofleriaceae bacterium]